jgi:anti-sigma factor RsiW
MVSFLGKFRRRVKGIVFNIMPMMITCRQFEDFLMAYMEGELLLRQKHVFEIHLKICRECREYLAAYQRTIEISRLAFEDPDAPLPADVPDDLVTAILAARKA